jgi:hypothetical protein
MPGFRKLFFGDPKEKAKKKARKQALDFERKEVYQQNYERGVIARAKKEGYKAGAQKPASTVDRLQNALNIADDYGKVLFGDMGGGGLFGSKPKKKQTKKKGKSGKTITIHVK